MNTGPPGAPPVRFGGLLQFLNQHDGASLSRRLQDWTPAGSVHSLVFFSNEAPVPVEGVSHVHSTGRLVLQGSEADDSG